AGEEGGVQLLGRGPAVVECPLDPQDFEDGARNQLGADRQLARQQTEAGVPPLVPVAERGGEIEAEPAFSAAVAESLQLGAAARLHPQIPLGHHPPDATGPTGADGLIEEAVPGAAAAEPPLR